MQETYAFPALNVNEDLRERSLEMLILAEEMHLDPLIHRRWLSYVREHELDLRTIEAHAGSLVITRAKFSGKVFDFDDEGPISACAMVLHPDGETVIDLLAWPLHRPHQFALATGAGEALGASQITNPATYFAGGALRIHRTPLAWLKANCHGVVLLRPQAVHHLVGATRIAGEDVVHARELAERLPIISRSRFLAPLSTMKDAA